MVSAWNRNWEAERKAERYAAWLIAVLQRTPELPAAEIIVEGKEFRSYTDEDLARAREYHEQLPKVKHYGDQK